MSSTRSPCILLVPICSFLLLSCSWTRAPAEPSITFTKIPPYAQGNPDILESIEGRATGALPGQKVVLYARSGDWWIQPFANDPFTSIEHNFTWSRRTHPGSAYAALLVQAEYRPNLKTGVLPGKGGPVLAVATVQGSAPQRPISKTVLFAGYQWEARDTIASPGGTPNNFDTANVRTDSSGFLHLRISGTPDHWTSAEVGLRRGLGYGTYRFVVRDLGHLEPSVVFTMVIPDGTESFRDMDIEISRWGESTNRNGQFVIQPYHIPANTVQFHLPAGAATFMLRWAPGRASFKAFHGVTALWDATALREHVFTSGVPSPGSESVRMNLYVFGKNNNPLQQESEVVVEAFEYLP